MTERERELLEPGRFTEPVVFHSSRAAFSIGLKEAGLSVSEGAGLAGHGDLATHVEYRRDRYTPRTVPEGALPDLASLSGNAESIFGVALMGSAEPNKGHQVAFIPLTASSESPDYPAITDTYLRAQKDSNLRPLAPEANALSS